MKEIIKVKGLVDEDFVNYKSPSMFIALGHCNWKCCVEAKIPITVCQNSELANVKEIEVPVSEIYHRYSQNPITEAIVIGGLEPFTKTDEVFSIIDFFRRNGCKDTFVIYTGFYEYEISYIITLLKKFGNVIVKFGRFVPNSEKIYDNVLGVWLASNNQYAERIG